MNKLEIVTQICRAYNRLDSSLIEVLASNSITYESQWVLDAIHTKKEVFEYLSAKFETIKKSETEMFAELAYWGEEPCLILSQNSKENKVATILVEVSDKKISRLDICAVPNWNDLKGTNEYPN